ncbi:MAG: tRNA modification GTPase [Lentimonas sp.]|jgi:tRNA modification GTPase
MDTIFAPITSTNRSSIIVLRISGSKSFDCLMHLGVKHNLEHRKSTLCNLRDEKNDEIIDQALVTFFDNPKSFTGEDVAEIALHGSVFILNKVIEMLLELDQVRLAEAGEFSKRAFLNDKIDLVEAEAIVDLIESETKLQHNQAMRQFQGDLGKIYEDWRRELIAICANIEAFIDFPDEDLPVDIVESLEARVRTLIKQIQLHLDDGKRGEKIRQGLSLAIIGKPNVGKSSLINYLAKSEVAIVSEIAGTTRDVIDVHLNISGVPVVISDTAGIRDSDDEIEKEGIKRALEKAKNADLKIVVSDMNSPDDFDQELIDSETILVINKTDLKRECGGDVDFSRLGNLKIHHQPILVSLKEKTNLDTLLEAIESKVESLNLPSASPPITRARYRHSLVEMTNDLSHFSLNKNIEFAAEDLRLAIREIGKITGKISVDDILDVVFSGFCIGK